MNNNQTLKQPDFDKFDSRSQLEKQIQTQETEYSGWWFDKLHSMTICLYKTTELKWSSFVKIPIRSSTI